MENMIKKIIQMDKQARELQSKAEQEKLNSKQAVEKRKQELYNQYEESSKEIIQMAQETANEEFESSKKIIDKQTSDLLNTLDARYQEMSVAWNEKIVKEVIGE